jgi:GMP synthase-like glutamine amidotransferase
MPKLIQFVQHVWQNYTDIKLFGICFGAQLIAHSLGGEVKPIALPKERPYLLGREEIMLKPAFFKLPAAKRAFKLGYEQKQSITLHVSHGLEVARMPEGATLLASSATTGVELYNIGNRALCT